MAKHDGKASLLRTALISSPIFLGPAIFLAVQIGASGFVDYPKAGGELGLMIVWTLLVALIFKFSLVDGLARLTLARKESIFAGLADVPGPRNWGVWAVTIVYVFEIVVFASIASVAGIMLSQLLGSTVPAQLLAFSMLAVVLIVLMRRSYFRLEKVVYVLIGGVVILLAYATIAAIWQDPSAMVPNIDALGESMSFDTVLLIGSGSGLSLLLYSVWLSDSARQAPEGQSMGKQLKEARRSLAVAFFLTGLIVTAIVIISYASGAMALQSAPDGLTGLPMASGVFILATFLMMMGVVLVSIDGRARAIAKMLRETKTTSLEKHVLYNLLVLLFVGIIAIALMFGAPTDALNLVAAVSSVMFAVTGFALVYLNFGLPKELRAGRLWMIVTLVGSALFLAIAIIEEETFLEFGVPLMLEIVPIIIILYLLAKRGALSWMMRNMKRWSGLLATTLVFSAISIAGTLGGLTYDNAIINFRDLGPMMAGLIGGPVAGGVVGLIGGLFRYSMGGWTALPCFIGTVSAGLLAGFLSVYWKGRINYLKAAFVAVAAELMHIFLYIPLLTLGTPIAQVEGLLRALTIPMLLANTFGILLFVYVLDRTHVLQLDVRPKLEAKQMAEAD